MAVSSQPLYDDGMDNHKYRRGQRVVFAHKYLSAAPGVYEITATLPYDGAVFSYRIKSGNEPHERVAREEQISAV